MRILVAGSGAEDCRSALWGTVVVSLRDMGHDVRCLDPAQPEVLKTNKAPEDQIDWFLEQHRFELALYFPSQSAWDGYVTQRLAQLGVRTVSLFVPELSNHTADAEPLPPGTSPPSASRDAERPGRQTDVIVVGDVSHERRAIVDELMRAGIDLRIYGEGWAVESAYQSVATGPVSFVFAGSVIRRSRLMLCWGSLAVPETVGPAHAALVARSEGVPVATLGHPDDGCDISIGADCAEVVAALLDDPQRLSAFHQGSGQRDTATTERWAALIDEVPSPRIQVRNPVRVSYLTAAYNIENYIGHAVDSVLKQTVTDVEVIVVNDGSSDQSAQVVAQRCADPRVRMVEQTNAGQMGRFDWIFGAAYAEARGDYIAVLGGDDVALPDRTERSLAVLEADPQAWMVHGGAFRIDEHGQRQGTLFTPDFSYDTSTFLRRCMGCNPIADPTVLMRRSAIESVGGYTSGFAYDFALWMKMGRVGRMRYLPNALSEYRMHGANNWAGDGTKAGSGQGRLLRERVRRNLSIADLYPALAWVPESDQRAWAAAYMDLGNLWLRYEPAPELALAEYQRAVEVCEDSIPELHVNMAVAHELQGDREAALAERARSQRGADGLSNPAALVAAQAVSQRPFVLPEAASPQSVICWDGTATNWQRVLLLVDWANPAAWWQAVELFVATFDVNDPIDLVLPTLGWSVPDVLSALGRAIPTHMNLEESAAITVEHWDDPMFIPLTRFADVIDARAALNTGSLYTSLGSIRARLRST